MKKVLIFSLTYYPKHIGGAEVAIKEITDRVPDTEIAFHMVTLRLDSTLPKKETIGNVTVHRVGFTKKEPSPSDLVSWPLKLNKLLFPFLGWWKATRLHRAHHYDAIWAMMANFAGFAAMFFKATHAKVPYLLTLQEGDPIPEIKHKVRFVYPLFRRIFTKADVVQAISTYLANWARDMGFTGPLEVVPNAVNTEHFSQEYKREELDALKQEGGKREDEVYMITTSRLVKKNAVDDVIAALAQLPERITFLVLGVGPDEEKLKALAEEKGVASRVRFLGQVEHSEMPKYLQISDIFIRPSRSEGMGNSFVEAMAAGLPVIATQEGGIADFLFDPERDPDKEPTGWAVDPDAPDQIAGKVNAILSDPAFTERVVANAQTLAREKYDWDLIAEQMRTNVFDQLFR